MRYPQQGDILWFYDRKSGARLTAIVTFAYPEPERAGTVDLHVFPSPRVADELNRVCQFDLYHPFERQAVEPKREPLGNQFYWWGWPGAVA